MDRVAGVCVLDAVEASNARILWLPRHPTIAMTQRTFQIDSLQCAQLLGGTEIERRGRFVVCDLDRFQALIEDAGSHVVVRVHTTDFPALSVAEHER
jgi:hypothetical protein